MTKTRPVKAMIALPSALSRLCTTYGFGVVTDAPVSGFVHVIRDSAAVTIWRVRCPEASYHDVK
jgi:hypothetical protein